MNTPRILTFDIPCLDHGRKGNSLGYGRLRRPHGNSTVYLVHRWVFLQEHGYLPPVVMHSCDNPRCIEITHLIPGDWGLNNKDRAAKGRSATRVVAKRRLTMDNAEEIRRRFAVRAKYDLVNGVQALAREFGVDTTVIYQITSGRTYQ